MKGCGIRRATAIQNPLGWRWTAPVLQWNTSFVWRHFHDPVKLKAIQARAVVCIPKQTFERCYRALSAKGVTSLTWVLAQGIPCPDPLSLSALSCVAIPTAATWSAHSIAIAHSFTPALHCHQHKLSLVTSQDRSCRTDIYGSCIVSAKGKIRWTSEISSQPPCGTHCSGPSLYRLLDTCFIYGLGVRDDKSSPLGSNNLLISVSDSGLNQLGPVPLTEQCFC